MFLQRIWILVLCLCLRSAVGYAWSGTGHMVVAEIAKNSLRPSALEQLEALIKVSGKDYPESNTFVTSSCWADDIKKNGVNEYDTWHYMLIPYDPNNLLTEEKKELLIAKTTNNNVQWALKQCIQSIANSNIKPVEKAMVVKFVIHFMADIHQPLHVTSLFTEKLPEGDNGGLLFLISGVAKPNLHEFWDSGLGMLEEVKRPLQGSEKRVIERLAEKCMDEFPLSKAKEQNLLNDDVAGWAQESYEIASKFCFNLEPGSQPTPTYVREGQAIVKKRLALAGYRLAFILNAMFFQDSDIKNLSK